MTSAADDSHCSPGVPVTSTGDDSHCPSGVPVTSAADDSHCWPGVPVTSAGGDAHCSPNGNKRYKGNYCCSVFSCNSSLKRHMGRKHPSESMAQSGTCQCQHCPFKCYRILDLRHHLKEKHGFTFATETVHLDNNAG